jgi:hypothetical protein
MILQTTQLSPRQKVAIEAKVASAEEREIAAQRMRYQLYLLDQSERRLSIEDCAALLLEKSEIMA